MNINKEKWISEVLNTPQHMKKAEANPFLYEKILFRMSRQGAGEEKTVKNLLPRWIAVASLVLVVNCISIVHIVSVKHSENKMTNTLVSTEIGAETIYSY